MDPFVPAVQATLPVPTVCDLCSDTGWVPIDGDSMRAKPCVCREVKREPAAPTATVPSQPPVFVAAADDGTLTIVVYGTPGPQGSKKFVGRSKKTGHAILVESSKKVAPWREAVGYAAREARDGGLPLDGPLRVSMVFTFARPAGHFGSGKNVGQLRASAPPRPHGRPDLSKLARSTEDALTEARAYADDARIVEYSRLAKVYVGSDVDALDAPGVKIEIAVMK